MQFNNVPNMRVPQNYRKCPVTSSQFVFQNNLNANDTQSSNKRQPFFQQKMQQKYLANIPSFLQNRKSQNVCQSVIFTSSSHQTSSAFQNPFMNVKQVQKFVQQQSKKKDQSLAFLKNNYRNLKQNSIENGTFCKTIKSPNHLKLHQSAPLSGPKINNSIQNKLKVDSTKQIFSPLLPKRTFEPQIKSPCSIFPRKVDSDKWKQKDQKQDQKSTVAVSQKSTKIPEFLKKYSPLNNHKKQSQTQIGKDSESLLIKLQKVSSQYCTQSQSPGQLKKSMMNTKFLGFKNYVETQNSFCEKKPTDYTSSSFAKISHTPQNNPSKTQNFNLEFGRLSSPTVLHNRRRRVQAVRTKQFSLSDFQLVDKMGKGAFGDVYIAREKVTGFLCVLKKISKKRIKELKLQESLMRQIKIQCFLSHKHLTSFYGFFADFDYLYLVLQILPDGSISQVKKKKRIPEMQVARYLRQVCEGLRYMHKQEIIHRDIKTQNIFLYDNYIKIGDFGCAVYTQTLRKTTVGCLAYVSPQQLNNQLYDDKIDVWSVGILTYELLTGKAPFQEDFAKISKKQSQSQLLKLQFPPDLHISQTCRDFLNKLLVLNPYDRMTIDQTSKHPFITKMLQHDRKNQQQVFGMYHSL